jgi:hypothetical protein
MTPSETCSGARREQGFMAGRAAVARGGGFDHEPCPCHRGSGPDPERMFGIAAESELSQIGATDRGFARRVGSSRGRGADQPRTILPYSLSAHRPSERRLLREGCSRRLRTADRAGGAGEAPDSRRRARPRRGGATSPLHAQSGLCRTRGRFCGASCQESAGQETQAEGPPGRCPSVGNPRDDSGGGDLRSFFRRAADASTDLGIGCLGHQLSLAVAVVSAQAAHHAADAGRSGRYPAKSLSLPRRIAFSA